MPAVIPQINTVAPPNKNTAATIFWWLWRINKQKRPTLKNKGGGLLVSVKRFMGAFWGCTILLAGLCGFAVIDLSTEHYMPGRFGAMLRVNSINSEGAVFEVMGQEYQFDTGLVRAGLEQLSRWSPLLPASPQISALLTGRAYHEAAVLISRQREERYSAAEVSSWLYEE